MIWFSTGVVTCKNVLDLHPDDIKRTFNVNVISHYHVRSRRRKEKKTIELIWCLQINQAFLPAMIERHYGSSNRSEKQNLFFSFLQVTSLRSIVIVVFSVYLIWAIIVHRNLRLSVRKEKRNEVRNRFDFFRLHGMSRRRIDSFKMHRSEHNEWDFHRIASLCCRFVWFKSLFWVQWKED